jgi:hypothetical protein
VNAKSELQVTCNVQFPYGRTEMSGIPSLKSGAIFLHKEIGNSHFKLSKVAHSVYKTSQDF